MSLLRIHIEDADGGDIHARLHLCLESGEPLVAASTLRVPWSRREDEDLRWYLEEYLFWPGEAAQEIAERIERRLEQFGCLAFDQIFGKTKAARGLWETARGSLEDTDIEIVDQSRGAHGLPWELLRETKDARPLAIRSRSFSHVIQGIPRSVAAAEATPDVLRILLVISRPDLEDDVPFRSVASRILGSLDARGTGAFHVSVLRPPTLGRLQEALDEARHEGHPYSVVHFDGHGNYLDLQKDCATLCTHAPFCRGSAGTSSSRTPRPRRTTELSTALNWASCSGGRGFGCSS